MIEDFNRQMEKLNASDAQLLNMIESNQPSTRSKNRDTLVIGNSNNRKYSLDSRCENLAGNNMMMTRHSQSKLKVEDGKQSQMTDTLPLQPIKQTLERLVSPVIDQTMQQQQLLIQQQQQLIQLQKEQNKLQQNLQGKFSILHLFLIDLLSDLSFILN